MFGHNDDNQAVMGSPTVQQPSMLDNVNTSDFQSSDSPATDAGANDSTAPATPQPAEPQHILTTDNPFVQSAMPADPAPAAEPTTDATTTTAHADNPTPAVVIPDPVGDAPAPAPVALDTPSPSAPVEPPVVEESQEEAEPQDEQASYLSALTQPDAGGADAPVDHDKLESMKQEALAHLEPLAEHLDGTPEETFKTTMMMIQANDNHTLLEKALASAKKITDDKARAQAMLDIINEINYFSQND